MVGSPEVGAKDAELGRAGDEVHYLDPAAGDGEAMTAIGSSGMPTSAEPLMVT